MSMHLRHELTPLLHLPENLLCRAGKAPAEGRHVARNHSRKNEPADLEAEPLRNAGQERESRPGYFCMVGE